jgi:phosphate transport system substrate-binding protein
MGNTRFMPTFAAVATALALGVAACGGDDGGTTSGSGGGSSSSKASKDLKGTIRIDGSSTVFPFAEAAGELFNEEQPGVQVTVGQSGTGGGFEKFCAGETDISDASRPIKDDEEAPVCEKAGIKYEEVQVANDGIAVVTNKNLTVDCLTVDQLKKIWEPKSKVANLKDAGDGLPDSALKLFGPGTDSGTFDFFTEQINGEQGASREDYEASEDDNQLVTGVSGTEGGLGYFGFSYYEQNQDKLNLVAVGADAASCKKPDSASIQDASYAPLSRPLFMYPSDKALARPEVKAFMEFVVNNYDAIAKASKIVPMTDPQAKESKTEVDKLAAAH